MSNSVTAVQKSIAAGAVEYLRGGAPLGKNLEPSPSPHFDPDGRLRLRSGLGGEPVPRGVITLACVFATALIEEGRMDPERRLVAYDDLWLDAIDEIYWRHVLMASGPPNSYAEWDERVEDAEALLRWAATRELPYSVGEEITTPMDVLAFWDTLSEGLSTEVAR